MKESWSAADERATGGGNGDSDAVADQDGHRRHVMKTLSPQLWRDNSHFG